MGSQTKKKTIQNAVASTFMIATAPVWAKGGGAGTTEGGKNQLGVNHLSLEQSPGRNAVVCADPNANVGKGGTNIMPNDLTIAINPFAKGQIALEFIVRDIINNSQNYILILAYSSQISPTPQIPTPTSTNKLQLDVNRTEIIAMMDIPAQKLLPQGATRLGAADPTPHSAVSFSINLSKQTLPTFINQNQKAYFQAALVTKADFESRNFEYMILSELDTVGFLENKCPDGSSTISAGEDDGMTKGGSPVQTPSNVDIKPGNNTGGGVK